MRVYEGNILTCDGQDRVCRYLVEDCGKIVYVGDELAGEVCQRHTGAAGG